MNKPAAFSAFKVIGSCILASVTTLLFLQYAPMAFAIGLVAFGAINAGKLIYDIEKSRNEILARLNKQ